MLHRRAWLNWSMALDSLQTEILLQRFQVTSNDIAMYILTLPLFYHVVLVTEKYHYHLIGGFPTELTNLSKILIEMHTKGGIKKSFTSSIPLLT